MLAIKELWDNPGVLDGSRNTVRGKKKNRIMPSGRRWMELETVLLSKKKVKLRKTKSTYHLFYVGSRVKDKGMEVEGRSRLGRGNGPVQSEGAGKW